LLYSKKVHGLKSGEYHIPNLVFCYDGNGLDVFAIKKKDVLNPSEKTKLYKAPFFNTYSDGSVCMGNAKIKKTRDITELIHNVETAFFKSEFTHTNEDEIVKGNLIEAYRIAEHKKSFQEDLLIESIPLHKLFK
jgi:PRTRC genetic system protein B